MDKYKLDKGDIEVYSSLYYKNGYDRARYIFVLIDIKQTKKEFEEILSKLNDNIFLHKKNEDENVPREYHGLNIHRDTIEKVANSELKTPRFLVVEYIMEKDNYNLSSNSRVHTFFQDKEKAVEFIRKKALLMEL